MADCCGRIRSRRQFMQTAGVAGLGLLAGCGRLPWQAAPPQKVPRVGLLAQGSSESSPARGELVHGLSDLGYVVDGNIQIDARFTEGQADRAPALAAELVQLPVDVMVVGGARAVLAAKQATSTIPIVIGFSSIDPVAEGLIASLARPGGNITGLIASVQGAQLGAKRLQLLNETLSGITRAAVLWDGSDPVTTARWGEIQAAAPTQDLHVFPVAVRDSDDLASALEALPRERTDALIVLHDTLTQNHSRAILQFAARSQLPAMYEYKEWVSDGGLIAYGPNIPAMWYRAAYFVDRILKGTKPADLPIEQPTTFDFVINLKTAQALGLTIPQHVLLQATEVIQ